MNDWGSNYLDKLQEYSRHCLFDTRLYTYTGDDSKLISQQHFFEKLLSNDAFSDSGDLSRIFFIEQDGKSLSEKVKNTMESIRLLIDNWGNKAKESSSTEFQDYYKMVTDAIQILQIMRVHFTWHQAKFFEGKPSSLFNRIYSANADDPIENDFAPDTIIENRLKGDFDYDFNHILYYRASNHPEFFKQFLHFLTSSANNSYKGLLLFSTDAMLSFFDYIKRTYKYKDFHLDYDSNGYAYLSFIEDDDEYDPIKMDYSADTRTTYEFKMVFHSKDDGFSKLVAYNVCSSSFDESIYRHLEPVHNCYSIRADFKNYLQGDSSEIIVPSHIDVFI